MNYLSLSLFVGMILIFIGFMIWVKVEADRLAKK